MHLYFIHSGYKTTQFSVHICTSNDIDATWLVDLVCMLAIINRFIEFIDISMICYFSCVKSQMNTIFGLTFVVIVGTVIKTTCKYFKNRFYLSIYFPV
jgi:hypothetical protein